MQEWQISGNGILHLRMTGLGCFLVLVLGRRNFHTRMRRICSVFEHIYRRRNFLKLNNRQQSKMRRFYLCYGQIIQSIIFNWCTARHNINIVLWVRYVHLLLCSCFCFRHFGKHSGSESPECAIVIKLHSVSNSMPKCKF